MSAFNFLLEYFAGHSIKIPIHNGANSNLAIEWQEKSRALKWFGAQGTFEGSQLVLNKHERSP